MVGLHAQCQIWVISTTGCNKKDRVHNWHAFKETIRYGLVKEDSKLSSAHRFEMNAGRQMKRLRYQL